MGDTWRVNGSLETVEMPAAADIDAARRQASDAVERWKAGEAADAQAILGRHPPLQEQKAVVLTLASEEFWQRRAAGEELDYMEFSHRFPGHQKSIQHLLYSQLTVEVTPYLKRLQQIEPPCWAWPELGTEFLGFPLLEALGSGAFAQVYLASEPKLSHRRVALKVSAQGMREAERLGRLRHPNIVPVYRVEQDRSTGLTAVCMPYLGRATLCDVLDQAFSQSAWPTKARTILETAQSRDALDVEETADPLLLRGTYTDGVLRLGEQLAAALHYTHQVGIFHLDLKPSNVLLTPGGRPMLLDFNLSLERGAAIMGIGGTLPYMSPEQIRASVLGDDTAAVDHRSDVFSLGVILYEMLCGSLPFDAPSGKPLPRLVGEHLLTQQQAGPHPLEERYPQVDRSLSRLIERCLSFDPLGRPESAGELAAALRGLLGRVSRSRRWLRNHRSVVYTGVLLAASLGGAVAGYALSLDPYWVRMYRAAQTAYAGSHYEQAVDLCNSSLQARPKEHEVLVLRGKAHQKASNYLAAAADYGAACEQINDPRLHARRAYCLSLANTYPPAILAYRDALAGGFANARVFSNLAACHEASSHYDKASAWFTKALEHDPKFALAYFGRALADSHLAQEDGSFVPTRSLDDIRIALRSLPPAAIIQGTAAIVYANAEAAPGHASQALSLLKQAVAMGFNPNGIKFPAIADDPEFHALCKASEDNQPAPFRWFSDPVEDD